MKFINKTDSKTIKIYNSKKNDINECQSMNKEINDLSLEPKSNTPSKTSGAYLIENSKSFKQRLFQDINTGGK